MKKLKNKMINKKNIEINIEFLKEKQFKNICR